MGKTKENLLLHVERISSEASKSNLDFSLIKCTSSVDAVSKFLNISKNQTILFSVIVETSLQRITTLESLSRFFKTSILKVMSILNEMEVLEKKCLVKRKIKSNNGGSSYSNFGFSISYGVIEALRTNDLTKIKKDAQMKLPNLLEYVHNMVEEREDNLMSTKQLEKEIDEILAKNAEQYFIKFLNKNLSGTLNKCVVIILAYYRITGREVLELDSIPEAIYDDISNVLEFRRNIINGNNELVKNDIISVKASEFSNEEVIHLTSKILNILYLDYPELIKNELKGNGLIDPESISKKRLFFNDELREQVNEFCKILLRSRFNLFKKEAKKSNISHGITAIFHGSPGTGKTEAAYQIAKKVNREIYMVDLSQSKSMWFGESEKQVKKIFDNYRNLTQSTSVEPILFINEADGLFSKRLNIGSGSTNTSQTVNTMQNILLQELENFKGILIATTNLTTNIDKAFERRFLFIIGFPRPDQTTREKIWKNRIPELSPKMAKTLAERFDITGGQIDNQIRKLVLKKVTHKNLNVFDYLTENCVKINGFNKKRKIGF